MYGHPAGSAEQCQRSSNRKGSRPAITLSNPGSQRSGDRSSDLSSHVHNAGKDTGTIARRYPRRPTRTSSAKYTAPPLLPLESTPPVAGFPPASRSPETAAVAAIEAAASRTARLATHTARSICRSALPPPDSTPSSTETAASHNKRSIEDQIPAPAPCTEKTS